MTTSNSKLAVGLDLGTMTMVATRSDSKESSMMRNVFLKLDSDEIPTSELANISYMKNEDDNSYCIVGNDAFKFANIFGQEVSRPMESGLISPKELNAVDVLTMMIKTVIGDIKDKDVYVTYSIPAAPIDESRSVTYHEKIFGRILSSLGVNHKPMNEAMAIIYNECSNEKFSGIAISFGAGMANCAVAFKGVEALSFSTARSGDWIDRNVAESLNTITNRVTSVKEKHFDLEQGFLTQPNKKIKRTLEALDYYYRALISYTVKKIITEFNEKVDMELDDAIPIVISGGTSTPKGFLEVFKEELKKYELPFEISDIRVTNNTMTSVSNGLMLKTMSDLS